YGRRPDRSQLLRVQGAQFGEAAHLGRDRLRMAPAFTWGNRVSNANPNYAPPNVPFPGYLNINATNDVSISLTKVKGRHTMKGGFYNTHSYKAQQRQGWAGSLTFSNDSSNPLDTGFGFSNAALG